MGRVEIPGKNEAETCPGCTEEAKLNDKDERARHKSRYALYWDILKNRKVEGPSCRTDHLSWIGAHLSLEMWYQR